MLSNGEMESGILILKNSSQVYKYKRENIQSVVGWLSYEWFKMEESEMNEIDPEQMIILKRAFDNFDQKKTGAISTDTVGIVLRMMGQSFNRQMLEDVIREVDVDGSGELDFSEFCLLATKFMNEENEEELRNELREAFRIYDRNNEGFIPTQVLKEILKELDDKLTEEELDGIIDEVDADGSGTVDFDEFMEMMTG